MLDAHLAKHQYLAGDTLTLADFTVAAPLFHAQGAGMPVGPYANVGAWFGRVSSLPCWTRPRRKWPPRREQEAVIKSQ